MPTSETSEAEAPRPLTLDERRQQIIGGFRAVAEHGRSIADRVDAYATWLEQNEVSEAALDLQVELLQSLHARIQ